MAYLVRCAALRDMRVDAQKKKLTPLAKSKKADITGPDDSAVKAKAQVVEEVKKEVPTEEPEEDEKAGAKRRSRRET